MSRRALRRVIDELPMIALLAIIAIAGAFVVMIVLPDLNRSAAAPSSPLSSPSPTPPTNVMAWMSLPENADCAACHLTEQREVGVRPVPALAHPLKGWTNCTACHANDRLVATAPGHAGIHATDCLICHKPADLPPPLSRPHREAENQQCLECHGAQAPLPSDMAHRPQAVCWLCHRLPEQEPPLPAHRISAGQADCLTCHGGGSAGDLPPDHATRTAGECLLCHEPQPGAVTSRAAFPTGPPGIRYGLAVVTR